MPQKVFVKLLGAHHKCCGLNTAICLIEVVSLPFLLLTLYIVHI